MGLKVIFSIIGAALGLIMFVSWWEDTKDSFAMAQRNWRQWLRSSHGLRSLYFIAIIVVPIFFVHLSGMEKGLLALTLYHRGLLLASTLVALLISVGWAYYLHALDVFERERVAFMVLTFALGCCSVWFLWPVGDALFDRTGWVLNGHWWNDWWFCVIRIGLLEEVVKIIPFLLMLGFSRQVNEPFDYIFYGSLCALGFAFVENIQYLYRTELNAVFGRALFSSVAHMFDTSVVCYTIVLARHRKHRWLWAALPAGLVLASLAHGFYDFWLISDGVSDYYLVTWVFLLATLQLWVVMKNNLLNISPFFHRGIKLNSSRFKYLVINTMLTTLSVAYLCKFLLDEQADADRLFFRSLTGYAYVLLFISLGFSDMELVPQYLRRLAAPAHLLKVFVPGLAALPNVSGSRVALSFPGRQRKRPRWFGEGASVIPGTLVRRVVMDGFTSWYLFEPDNAIHLSGFEAIVLRARESNDALNSDEKSLVTLRGVRSLDKIAGGVIHRPDTVYLGHALIWGEDGL